MADDTHGLSEAEMQLAKSFGMTAAEWAEERGPVTERPDHAIEADRRRNGGSKSLTAEELTAAKAAGMTPEEYAAYRTEAGANEWDAKQANGGDSGPTMLNADELAAAHEAGLTPEEWAAQNKQGAPA